MDLSSLCEAVASAPTVAPTGARTHWGVGNDARPATEVRAPAGVVRYEPADMTVTVGAGISFAKLDATLAEHGQQCALDPLDAQATVGGILACGLSGRRRLGHGPVRDHVLEVRIVRGDGRVVKGGGPTVKNVTGYDLPRLFVGSFGTLGVLAQATLRCRPRAAVARWFRADGDPPAGVLPSALVWDGRAVLALLEGSPGDVETRGAAMVPAAAPAHPEGLHRGRISVAPGRVRAVGAALDGVVGGGRWCAELGVGTVHVAADEAEDLVRARGVAHEHGGWMLREAGCAGMDGFGRPLPNLALMRRIKTAFDPAGKLSPGRLPL